MNSDRPRSRGGAGRARLVTERSEGNPASPGLTSRDRSATRSAQRAVIVGRPELSPIHRRSWRRCPDCARPLPIKAWRCQRRTCPGYAETWAKDNRRRLLDNLDAYDGRAVMVTLTPPGQDRLPWDEDVCRHLGPHEHTGKNGVCKIVAYVCDAWNEKAPERARELNRVAKLRADRALAKLGMDEKRGKLAHAWEHQKRGALHQHIIVPMGTDEQDAWGTNIDARWSRYYVAALDELAPTYGFGFVDDHPINEGKPRPAREAAAYLSSYLISGKAGKATITETVRSRVVPSVAVYVSAKLTAKTFCTMRNLRRARRVFMWRCGKAERPVWPHLELLQVLVVLDRLSPALVRNGP